MPVNKVKKFFKSVEVWAWCDICREMVNLHVNKEEISDGLSMGMYKKEYKHKNNRPDPEDTDDKSGGEHSVYVYINDKFDVTGVNAFFGESPTMEAMEAATTTGEVQIPIVVKEIPPMSVHLGMLTQEEFKVLKICDGMNTIEQVASIAGKDVSEVEKMMEKLHKKGLVDIIKRTK